MDYKDLISEFSVYIYDEPQKYNQVLSKARCRIFYKGFNRNGTYISDEFAQRLISTVSYAPIKGIYDPYEGDYADHGATRGQGRIYGIVPENPNFAWEPHLDEDGIERTYACVDVLLYTALYQEAGDIIHKAQSMELYAPSIKGNFQFVNGRKAYVYEDACFLGLQVLGEAVEPCFEGAAFYTLVDSLKELMAEAEKEKEKEMDGGKLMELNFKLSDSQKYNMIFNLLNPEMESETPTITYTICDVYDDYAITYNLETGNYERVYYTKDDQSDSLQIDRKEVCYMVDVTEAEKTALESMRALNGDTYEKLDENFVPAQDLVERDNTIATLTTEKDNLNSDIDSLNAEIATLSDEKAALTTQIDELNTYKKSVEDAEKQAIFDKYAELLDDEVISAFAAKKDEYTNETLEKELAFELVKANQSIFSKSTQQTRIPKSDELPKSELQQFVEKYRK